MEFWLNTCHGLVSNDFAASHESPGILLCGVEVQRAHSLRDGGDTHQQAYPLHSLEDARTLFVHLMSESPSCRGDHPTQHSYTTFGTQSLRGGTPRSMMAARNVDIYDTASRIVGGVAKT